MEAHHYCRQINDDFLQCALEQHRNEAMDVDRAEKRRAWSDLLERAHPQDGVALLDGAFPAGEPVPGVVDRSTGR
ncbi:hypothetical protein [Micromonospora coxensis]|uniref:hypothetical protein n=1 Tax=Micromonospora coxensis TaxID=356852 RepID=UPI000B5B0A76|nr:hypothetical protein [Micromonospora coxensis]